MSKIPIECVGDFLKIINEISKKSNDAQLYFRGQSDASWGIDSSLSRLLNDSDIRPYAADGKSPEWGLKVSRSRLAADLFDSFKDKFVLYSDTKIIKDYVLNDIDLHVMAQHYQLPTRVVDITRNPLISLYFATEKCEEGKDVSVFILKDGFETISSKLFLKKIQEAKSTYGGFFELIVDYINSNLNFYRDELIENIKRHEFIHSSSNGALFLCGCKMHPVDLRSLCFDWGADRDDIFLKLKEIAFENGFNYEQSHASIEIFNNNLQVIEPLPINQRVKNQQGLLLFSPSIDEPVFSKSFFSELNTIDGIEMSDQLDQNAACYKVVISYQFVDAIRKELERYGISRDFIYPELQNFTDYMKGKIINKYLN